MRELKFPPARQVEEKVRQGNNKKKKKETEIKAKQGVSKHQKCRTQEVKSQRPPLVITDYYEP